jgi:hypothetical protein
MKKTILMIALTLMVFGCKKAQELISNVKNKLIEGYWADMNGLVVEFKNNEGKVVDYGTSRLRNHTNLFNKNTSIYIKNISRTSANSWTADITVGVYVNNDCVGLKYEKTSIEMVDSNGTENLKFSNEFTYLLLIYQNCQYFQKKREREECNRFCAILPYHFVSFFFLFFSIFYFTFLILFF